MYTRLEQDLDDYHPADDPTHGSVSTRTNRGDWNEGHCSNPNCTFPNGHDGLCSDQIVRSNLRPRKPRGNQTNCVYSCCSTEKCVFYNNHCGDCMDEDEKTIPVEGVAVAEGVPVAYGYVPPESDPLSAIDRSLFCYSVVMDDVSNEVVLVASNTISDVPCPKTYKDAISSPLCEYWKASMLKEHNALLENDTWSYVSRSDPRLRGRKPTKSRWVYTIKYNRNGTIERYKSRFVVCGYSQREGIDYDRAFSSTLRATTFRTLLSVAAGKKLKLRHIDISNAFTQAKLDDVDLFVEPAKGFEQYEWIKGIKVSMLLHLQRALYGTKQASRLWQETLRHFLVSELASKHGIKFSASTADPCLYRATLGNEEIILGVYVDDIIIAYRGKRIYELFESALQARFTATPSTELKWFLGMAIDQHDDYSVHVSHELAISKLVDKFIPNNTVTRDCPPELFNKLDRAQNEVERAKAQEFQYASLVGALLYISVMSRPDIAFHTSVLAKFLADPSPECCNAAIQLLQYVHCTRKKRMCFSGKVDAPEGFEVHSKDIEGNAGFVAYSDSSWGNQYPYPMFGYGIYLYGGLVSYSSKQLKTVAFSSCEAEYAAASYTCKEIEFVRNVCADMGVVLQGRLVIGVDNTAAIDIAHNVGVSGRTKHFDRAIHYLRDLTQMRRVLPFFVKTELQRADGYTKALSKDKFVRWCKHVVE